MKYIDEYRNASIINTLASKINQLEIDDCRIMEICGGQTHTILKYNIEQFLPETITLIHGPGCPVCVTPISKINIAIELAFRKDIILCSFGDMLRVPGSKYDMLSAKALGADIRIVYSPLDAIEIAKNNPGKNVVFFAVGFETTAPANAMSVVLARKNNLKNYSILCSHLLVPPAIEALLSSGNTAINGLLAAGHVCTVMGYEEYLPILEKYKIPIVVTGFEPADILSGIYFAAKQLSEKRSCVENQYTRAVNKVGNITAKALLNEVFDKVDSEWRGLGIIQKSGLKLKKSFTEFDAEEIFNVEVSTSTDITKCIGGKILQGINKPPECLAFANECIPEHPLGAPMVSSEGACAAYFHYHKMKLR